jgi:sugar phosphate isomerase/epimerase
MTLPPIGAQLMVLGGHPTIKYDMAAQTDVVLDSLAASGYAGVEGGPRDAAAYKQALDSRGLRYGGSHVSLGVLAETDNISGLIEYLHTLGSRDICNSGLRHWHERSAADYHDAAAVLNAAGQRFHDAGMTLHYHHHDFEFEKVEGQENNGGKTGLDILLGETDPALVDLCVDIAWVQKGGGDPGEFLMQHQDRVSYLHFKDYNAEGDWTELGRGVVNIGGVMEVLPSLPRIRWVMLEQDKTTMDPLESLAVSRRYLKDTFGY